eukprot:m.126510 g.126510  ORF g.126510 m.126510 type:complete len:457 (-) comp15774_c0_seq10:1502-2872(-)
MAPVTKPASRTWNVSFQEQGQIMINQDGLRLFRRFWKPESVLKGGHPKAIIFFCHGFADHSERQAPMAKEFLKEDWLMVSHDHVGHGRSEGIPVHIDSYDIYVRDVLADVTELRRVHPGVPLFLGGASMGGLIACLTALKEVFAGAYLIAPAVVPDPATASPCLIRVARCLNSCNPKMKIKKLDVNFMTRNEEAKAAFVADPLVYHGKGRVGWATQTLDSMAYLQEHASELKLPILLQQGEDDKVTSADGARFLADNVSGPIVYKTYSGMYHDLVHELEDASKIVLADIVGWIQSVLHGTVKSQRSLATKQTTSALETAAMNESLREEASAISLTNGSVSPDAVSKAAESKVTAAAASAQESTQAATDAVQASTAKAAEDGAEAVSAAVRDHTQSATAAMQKGADSAAEAVGANTPAAVQDGAEAVNTAVDDQSQAATVAFPELLKRKSSVLVAEV